MTKNLSTAVSIWPSFVLACSISRHHLTQLTDSFMLENFLVSTITEQHIPLAFLSPRWLLLLNSLAPLSSICNVRVSAELCPRPPSFLMLRSLPICSGNRGLIQRPSFHCHLHTAGSSIYVFSSECISELQNHIANGPLQIST